MLCGKRGRSKSFLYDGPEGTRERKDCASRKRKGQNKLGIDFFLKHWRKCTKYERGEKEGFREEKGSSKLLGHFRNRLPVNLRGYPSLIKGRKEGSLKKQAGFLSSTPNRERGTAFPIATRKETQVGGERRVIIMEAEEEVAVRLEGSVRQKGGLMQERKGLFDFFPEREGGPEEGPAAGGRAERQRDAAVVKEKKKGKVLRGKRKRPRSVDFGERGSKRTSPTSRKRLV